MLHALFALSLSHALDCARRPVTLLVAAVGIGMILSLRWFSAFGLGYEVVQLQELGVYTAGLMSVVAAVLFSMPREDEGADDAESGLLTRPVAPWVFAAGPFIGRALLIAGLCMLWFLTISATLYWYELAEPRLFSYRGASSASAEAANLPVPMIAQWFAACMLLALLQPLARVRRPVLIAVGGLLIYLLGYGAASLGGVWAHVLPDFSRHDLTPRLWGETTTASLATLAVHFCAWCAVGLLADMAALRMRSAA